jgi:hypothetical protein
MNESIRPEEGVGSATASGEHPAGEIVVNARTRAGARTRALAGLTLGMSAFMAVTAVPSTTVSFLGQLF